MLLKPTTWADIDKISAQLTAAKQKLEKKQAKRQELTGSIAGLEGKIAEVTAARDSFTAALSGLEEQSAGINRDLEATIASLPANVTLSSIGHITSILTITGRAPSEKQVLLYLTNLDSSGRFSNITITNMTRIEGEDESESI